MTTLAENIFPVSPVLLVGAADYLVLIALCVAACVIGGVAGRYVGGTLMPASDEDNPGGRVVAVFGAMAGRMLVTVVLLIAIVLTAPRWVAGEADAARFAAGVIAACSYALLCLAEPAWAIRAIKGGAKRSASGPE